MYSLNRKLIVFLALTLLSVAANAGTVYVLTISQQFGTVDLGTGVFEPIGPGTPEGTAGLVLGSNGSLFTLTFSGDLESINPATGLTTVIGATGLGDSSDGLGGVDGQLYALDYANNLYSVDPDTATANLIGPTGIPGVPAGFPSFPATGVWSVFDETLTGLGGKLYATFDATTFDPNTGTIVSTVIPDYVYQIDPLTGKTIRVTPTDLALSASAVVNGTFYAFKADTGELRTLDLINGKTNFVTNVDQAAGLIVAAAAPAVPEPASVVLSGIGIAAAFVFRRRRAKGTALRHRY